MLDTFSGTIILPDHQRFELTMSQAHWLGLRWLIENEADEGEILTLIERLLLNWEEKKGVSLSVGDKVAHIIDTFFKQLFESA